MFTAKDKIDLLVDLVKAMDTGCTPCSEVVAKQHVKYAAIQLEMLIQYAEMGGFEDEN